MYLNLNAGFNNLAAHFTTRDGGVSPAPFAGLNLALHTGDDVQNVLANRERLVTELQIQPTAVKTVRQVHGAEIEIVAAAYPHTWSSPYEELPAADGLITAEQGIYLSVFLADCLAVYIYDHQKKVVALLHAGWRSVYQKIIPKALALMIDNFSSQPADCFALISPGLKKCCFEVKPENFPFFESAWQAQNILEERAGKHYFDLTGVVRQHLVNGGLAPTNISESNFCTACDTRFFSYRREGTTGRMAALAGLK